MPDSTVRVGIEVLNTPEAIAHLQAFRDQLAGIKGTTATVGVDTTQVTQAQAGIESLNQTIQRARGTANITIAALGAQDTIAQLSSVKTASDQLIAAGGRVNLNIAAVGGPKTEEDLRAISAAAKEATDKGKVTINISAVGAKEVEAQVAAINAVAADLKGQNIAFKIDTTGAAEAAALAKEEAVAAKEAALARKESAAAAREEAVAQQENVRQLQSATQASGRTIAGVPIAAAAPLALAAGGIEVGKQASDQATQFSQLQANTTLTNAQMTQVAAGIKEIAATSPAPIDQIATAFRHVTNEGFSTADALKIVKEAEMSAVSTGANLGDVGNALAIVMHDFSLKADDAGKAMNVLHLAAAQGNVTLEEFATASAKVWADAGRLGVSLTDAAGAMSSLTRAGYSAPQAATLLDGLMLKIINTTPAAKKEIEALSKATGVDLVTDFTQAGLAARGLPGVLEDIQKATRGNSEEMFKLLPALRGGRGELALTSAEGINFRDVLTSLNDTMAGKTTPTMDSYARALGLTSSQMGVFLNQIKLAAASVGQDFIVPLTNLLQILNSLPDWTKKGAIEIGLLAAAIKTGGLLADLLTSSTAKLGASIAGNAEAMAADTVATNANTAAQEKNVAARAAASVAAGTEAKAVADVATVETAGAAAKIGTAVAGIGKGLGQIAVPVAISLVAYEIVGKPLQDAILNKVNELERPQVDLSNLPAGDDAAFAAEIKKRIDKQQAIVDEYLKYKDSAGYKIAKIENLGGELQSDRDYANALKNIDAYNKAASDYLASHAGPLLGPAAPGAANATVGKPALTDEEVANLIEHQSLVDAKRAELQAKGAPQGLIDRTTDESGQFSKTEIALAKKDLAEWTKIYDDRTAQAKAANAKRLADDKEAAKQESDLAIANATQVENAWKAAASAINTFDKKLDAGTSLTTLAGAAENLQQIQQQLAEADRLTQAIGGPSQSAPHFDALVALATQFKAITDAEDQAKASYEGYLVTLSQTDKRVAELDSIKKGLLSAVDAAQKRVLAGTASDQDLQLIAGRTEAIKQLNQGTATLGQNQTTDWVKIEQSMGATVAGIVQADKDTRALVDSLGGGKQLLLTIKTDADKAQQEIKDKLEVAHQTTLNIKSNAAEIQTQLTELAKDRDANLKVHVNWVDPSGRSISAPASDGSIPGVDAAGGYTSLGGAPVQGTTGSQPYGGGHVAPPAVGPSGERYIPTGASGQAAATPAGWNQYQPLTTDQFAAITNSGARGGASPWANDPTMYAAVLAAAQKYGVDPRVLLAWTKEESGNGTTSAANLNAINNFGGIQFAGQPGARDAGFAEPGHKVNFAAFNTPQDFFNALAANLSTGQYAQDYQSGNLTAVSQRYAESPGTRVQDYQRYAQQYPAGASTQATAQTNAAATDQTSSVFAQAQASLAKAQGSVQDFYGWCERFVDNVLQKSTGLNNRFNTADARVKAAIAGDKNAGTVIDEKNARPGDLVGWMGNQPEAGDPAGHVGIFAGGGQYIGTDVNGISQRRVAANATYIRPPGVSDAAPPWYGPGTYNATGGTNATNTDQSANIDKNTRSAEQMRATVLGINTEWTKLNQQIQGLDSSQVQSTVGEFEKMRTVLDEIAQKKLGPDATPTDKIDASNQALQQALQLTEAWAKALADAKNNAAAIPGDIQAAAAAAGGGAVGAAVSADLNAAVVQQQSADAIKGLEAQKASAQQAQQAQQQAAQAQQAAIQEYRRNVQEQWRIESEHLQDRTTAELRAYEDTIANLDRVHTLSTRTYDDQVKALEKIQKEGTAGTGIRAEAFAAQAGGQGTTASKRLAAEQLAIEREFGDNVQRNYNKQLDDLKTLQIQETRNYEDTKFNADRAHVTATRNLADEATQAQRNHANIQAQWAAEDAQRQQMAQQQQQQAQQQSKNLDDQIKQEQEKAKTAQDAAKAADDALKIWQDVGTAAQQAGQNAQSAVNSAGSGTYSQASQSAVQGSSVPPWQTWLPQGSYAAGGVIPITEKVSMVHANELISAPGYTVTPLRNRVIPADGGGTTVNLNLGDVGLVLSERDKRDIQQYITAKINAARANQGPSSSALGRGRTPG